MSMNASEIKSVARANTIALLSGVFEANGAVQFDDASFAILQVVDEQEVWTEVTVKSKAYKPTKVSPAFDPYEVAEEWKAGKEMKAAEKKAKEEEKARKLAEKKAKEVKKEEEAE